MPDRHRLAEMFRADLEAAGIAYRDGAGLVADFHSLRHTFITNLARGGVHPKVAQSLARHSTITLTMDRYSHTLVGEHADALDVLPDLSANGRQTVRATGTDDTKGGQKNLASCLALSERFSQTSVDFDGQGNAHGDNVVSLREPLENSGKTAICQRKPNGEGGIRTLGDLATTPVFETGPISHSGTSPGSIVCKHVICSDRSPSTGRLSLRAAHRVRRILSTKRSPCRSN